MEKELEISRYKLIKAEEKKSEVSKKIDEIEFIDTFRFTINKVTFPIFYSFQTWIIHLFFGWNIAGIYVLTSLLLILLYTKLSTTNTEA